MCATDLSPPVHAGFITRERTERQLWQGRTIRSCRVAYSSGFNLIFNRLVEKAQNSEPAEFIVLRRVTTRRLLT